MIGPYQVLRRRARVDLEAMAIKGYSVFPKAPALLGPHHQTVKCHIRTLVGGALPPCRGAVSVFYSPCQLGNLERYNKRIAAGGDHFEGDESFMCVLLIKVPIRKKSQKPYLMILVFLILPKSGLLYYTPTAYLHRGKIPPTSVLCMTINFICWCLENVEYTFITITPKSTVTSSGSIF